MYSNFWPAICRTRRGLFKKNICRGDKFLFLCITNFFYNNHTLTSSFLHGLYKRTWFGPFLRRVYYGYAKQRTSRDNNTGSIISLRSAGDISLSGGGGGGHQYRQAATGLLLPASGSGQPTTIIPLKRQNRESGDYATSDVQSVW